MDLSTLTNDQLFDLFQSKQTNAHLKNLCEIEFKTRNLSKEQIQEIVFKFDSQYKHQDESLPRWNKLLLIAFPFFLDIQSLIAGRHLANRNLRKWKDYWLYVCIGLLVWTILIIFWAKFYLFRKA